jgi:hypothetical protein
LRYLHQEVPIFGLEAYPRGPYTSHVLLTYVAELLGEDEDWLPTITRPPGDRVIEVIGLFCLTRRSQDYSPGADDYSPAR